MHHSHKSISILFGVLLVAMSAPLYSSSSGTSSDTSSHCSKNDKCPNVGTEKVPQHTDLGADLACGDKLEFTIPGVGSGSVSTIKKCPDSVTTYEECAEEKPGLVGFCISDSTFDANKTVQDYHCREGSGLFGLGILRADHCEASGPKVTTLWKKCPIANGCGPSSVATSVEVEGSPTQASLTATGNQ